MYMETQTLSIANAQSQSFSSFIRLLIWRFKPLQLFCFAESSLLKEDSGCFTKKSSSADSHYCLLMVTESEVPTEMAVQKVINSRSVADRITVLCYSQKTVSAAIVAKNRFFLTIYSSAKLLYSRDQLLQSAYLKEFSDLNNFKKAQRKSSHYLALVDSFFAGANHSFYNQAYPMSVLMLHHVTRQCLTLLLRVHLFHQVEIRSLITLIGLCRSFTDQPQHLLLSGDEDKKLFKILIKSGSEVYGTTAFSVSEADAKQLLIRVSTLVKLTQSLCKDKMEQLNEQAALYEQSLTAPVVN